MKIPGYNLGTAVVPSAPITLDDLAQIQATALFGPEDVEALRASLPILEDQTEAILDVWYGFVASQPQLIESFKDNKTGEPSDDYLGAVRRRFGRWIIDTARADYDQAWLDYQFEIGRRHHTVGKNKTDGVDSAPLVLFRYMVPLAVPILTTLKPFLANKGASTEQVEKMHAAWVKSVLIQATLWCHPYVAEGTF